MSKCKPSSFEIPCSIFFCSPAPKAQKKVLLEQVNRDLAVLRWLVRMAKERKLLSVRQYGYASPPSRLPGFEGKKK